MDKIVKLFQPQQKAYIRIKKENETIYYGISKDDITSEYYWRTSSGWEFDKLVKHFESSGYVVMPNEHTEISWLDSVQRNFQYD